MFILAYLYGLFCQGHKKVKLMTPQWTIFFLLIFQVITFLPSSQDYGPSPTWPGNWVCQIPGSSKIRPEGFRLQVLLLDLTTIGKVRKKRQKTDVVINFCVESLSNLHTKSDIYQKKKFRSRELERCVSETCIKNMPNLKTCNLVLL